MSNRAGKSMEERFLRAGAVEPLVARRRLPRFVRYIGAGLLRLLAWTAIAAGIAGGAGVAYGALSGSADLWRSVALGLYVGGAAMVTLGLLTGGRPMHYRGELGESLGRGGGGGVGAVVLVGVLVVLLGVAVDVLRA